MRRRAASQVTKSTSLTRSLQKTTNAFVNAKGMILSKISFTFPRFGVWFEKGAGRGYAGQTGRTRWKRADGSEGRVNPNSLGKMNQGERQAKPWFNPTFEKNYPLLKQLVLEGQAKATLKDIKNVLMK
jgi:hypothetical protein